MANIKRTNNTVSAKKEEKVVENIETEEISVDKPVPEKKQRVFQQEDLIPCRSMVSGQLFIEGVRSHLLYTFADYNDVNDIEYRDLIYMVRTHGNKDIYDPRIIIEDEDFIAQNPKLSELYSSMYTDKDLIEIIELPVGQMVDYINTLPVGCKNAIKGIAATMIDSGALDSVQKIKALDEIFGTDMLLTLVQE